jgi:hypothetical protein
MTHLIRAGAIGLAIFSSVGFAAAQGTAPGYNRPGLSPTQRQTVSQGLANSPSQTAPTGAQPQIGDKVPDSMNAKAMPGDVANQVPEARSLLFVRLPDRVLLIDPDTKVVGEIVMDSDSSTVGSNPNPANTSGQQPK